MSEVGAGDHGLDQYLHPEDQIIDKLDIGISVLDPSLDKLYFDTGSLANDLGTEELLTTLISLPSDLFGFYTQFAVGVRRGFNDIVSKLSGGPDIGNLLDKPASPSYRPGLKTADILKYLKGKKESSKTGEDDPSSPYSVNYSWGSLPTADYQVPHQSGYFTLETPSHRSGVAVASLL